MRSVPQHQVHLLQLADAKIAGLESQLRALKDDKAMASTQLATLAAQVQRREEEIERSVNTPCLSAGFVNPGTPRHAS